MAISKEQRVYNMIDPELVMFSSNLCNTMTRDLSSLAVFGVTTPDITNLNALVDAFEIFPPDEVYLGELMTAIQAVDDIAVEVRETLRTMALRVEVKFGLHSGDYKSLKMFGMNQMPDMVLLGTARNVHTRCTGYLTDLAPLGLTQPMLDDFDALNDSFMDAQNVVATKIAERDSKSLERVQKGNEIYSFVSKYCEFGKRFYAMTDPAKYNDYVMYPGSVAGPLVAVTGLAYNMLSQIFTWGTQANATSYSLEASSDNSNFVEIYSGAATTFTYNAGGAVRYYRCRARNSGGFGDYSNVINVTYSETLDVPHNVVVIFSQSPNQIHLTWDAVTGAESYLIYGCEVNIGDLPTGFAMRGSSLTNSYTESVILEKRYYYVVYPIAGAEVGLPSQVAFKDTI